MKLMYTLLIFGFLQIMFIMINCNTIRNVANHRTVKKDDVPRVKIKVFRGPTEEINGQSYAIWGYWIQQPGG